MFLNILEKPSTFYYILITILTIVFEIIKKKTQNYCFILITIFRECFCSNFKCPTFISLRTETTAKEIAKPWKWWNFSCWSYCYHFLEFSHGSEKLQMILLWGNTASAGASRILAQANLFCLSLVLTLVFTYMNTFLSILTIVLTIFAS